LASKRSKTPASTDDRNCLPWASSRLFQPLVDGDTCTENGSNGIEGNVFGNSGDMCGFANGVLLESSIDCVAGKKGFGAEGFVPCLAEITSKA